MVFSTPSHTPSASLDLEIPHTDGSPATPATPATPAIVTPARKIRDMLAAFDTDSDSDNSSPTRKRPRLLRLNSNQAHNEPPAKSTAGKEGEDDEDIFVLKGRMAARMQQETGPMTSKSPQASDNPSEDDLPTARPRRRLTKGKGASRVEESNQSPIRERALSPLFVSSPSAGERESGESDRGGGGCEEVELRPEANSRFLTLVTQKRKEKEEKERIDAERKAARANKVYQFSSDVLSNETSDDDDNDAGRRLTQHSRPTRKASKKALEEMNRETQRMSRNMQLTHQAKTRKKITKESFFARFNSMQPGELGPSKPVPTNSSTIASSPPLSGNEGHKDSTSPPTSPPQDAAMEEDKLSELTDLHGEEPTELPSIEDMLAQPLDLQQLETALVQQAESRGQQPRREQSRAISKFEFKQANPVRVCISRQSVAQHQKEDSDSDLEVITSPAKCRRIAVFENLRVKQAQESTSMLKLKALAHLNSPTRRSAPMTPAELSVSLRIQARQQAMREREERVQELRAKGIIIETAEERAAMEADVEDLMERARKEGEDIARKEKTAREKDGSGDTGLVDSEEEEYELSGSDDDDDAVGENDSEDGGEIDDNWKGENDELIENEAEETEESEDGSAESESGDENEKIRPLTSRRKRPARVIFDDEDDHQELQTPMRTVAGAPGSVHRPLFPDLPGSDGLALGLTQAFAATLGDNNQETEDSLEVLRSLPDPGLPISELLEVDSRVIVKDSQEHVAEDIDLLAGYTQSDARISESPAARTWSQFSQIPEPTQDAGFVLSPFDQSKRFLKPPMSSVETVLLPETDSPTGKKRGRFLRRRRVPDLSDVEEDGYETRENAFDVIKRVSRNQSLAFDKSKSLAKDIIDEIAAESDDEYAGLGGATDESAGEEDEYDKEIINDESGEVVDEKELAALNANHQRAMDEKHVSKLLKDITTGALRRRRGGGDDLDVDDSDDERIARRRQKQREFAKMRKALLADEKIGEIADNPKKQAFFKAIEDRDSEDEVELDFGDPNSDNMSSQDVQADITQNDPPMQEQNTKKRPLELSVADIVNRPPPHLRRTAAGTVSRKPSTLTEIRETLSFLIETPECDSFREDASVDDDDDDDDKSLHMDEAAASVAGAPNNELPLYGNIRRSRGRVVDRLALLRAASSKSAGSGNSRLAFQATSTLDQIPNIIGSKHPPPLRHDTSSSSSASSSVRTTTGPPIRPFKAKNGAVNSYTAARERERERELKIKQQEGGSNIEALLSKQKTAGVSGLGKLIVPSQWE